MLKSIQSLGYTMTLYEEDEKRDSAKKLNKTECQRCGFCCFRRTCVPTPDELKIIADFLKMPIDKMINEYMVVDYTPSTPNKFLRWANKKQRRLTGKLLSGSQTWLKDDCIMYDSDKKECLIHSVKPENAKITKCWDSEDKIDYENNNYGWGPNTLIEIFPWLTFDNEEYDEEEDDDDE